MVTREKDGKEQLTTDLAEEVTASEVTESVQNERKGDLHEQLLFMDPIREAGAALPTRPPQHNTRIADHQAPCDSLSRLQASGDADQG